MDIEKLATELHSRKNLPQKEILARLKKLRHALQVEYSSTHKLRPTKVGLGDIFFHGPFGHPCLIIGKQAKKDKFLFCCLSTKSTHSVTTVKHRAEMQMFATSSIGIIGEADILKTYRGTISKFETSRVKAIVMSEIKKFK